MTTKSETVESTDGLTSALTEMLGGCDGVVIRDILTETAPELIWLQVDPLGSEADRDEPFPPLDGDGVTWCWEQIGGQEVEYVRADLVRAALPINTQEQERDDPVLYRLAKLLGVVPPNA